VGFIWINTGPFARILVFSGFLSLPLLKDDKAIGVADVDASEERGWQ
jgi:hypothetical protein